MSLPPGSRRDFTFFVVGGVGAHIYDDAMSHGDPVAVVGDIIAGFVVLGLVWAFTGWRISRRELP